MPFSKRGNELEGLAHHKGVARVVLVLGRGVLLHQSVERSIVREAHADRTGDSFGLPPWKKLSADETSLSDSVTRSICSHFTPAALLASTCSLIRTARRVTARPILQPAEHRLEAWAGIRVAGRHRMDLLYERLDLSDACRQPGQRALAMPRGCRACRAARGDAGSVRDEIGGGPGRRVGRLEEIIGGLDEIVGGGRGIEDAEGGGCGALAVRGEGTNLIGAGGLGCREGDRVAPAGSTTAVSVDGAPSGGSIVSFTSRCRSPSAWCRGGARASRGR